jgi:hypothetical protein
VGASLKIQKKGERLRSISARLFVVKDLSEQIGIGTATEQPIFLEDRAPPIFIFLDLMSVHLAA